MSREKGLILITGPPGVGKTTLVRKVCENLLDISKIVCNGFYTEEVRSEDGKKRIGFDIVTLNNNRGTLSRECSDGRGPFVGKYCVFVKDFECVALPLIHPSSAQDLLIIDEVGKMELKSKLFENAVEKCIMKTNLLVTVPYNSGQGLRLVDKLKNHPNAQVFIVCKENRDHLPREITEKVLVFVRNKRQLN